MASYQTKDTMPKLGHVTDLREQWLVRADGALAHRLQDREISSHLCENRYRNQQIREDYPLALNEQRDIENEAYLRELSRRHQADIDAEIAREMAEINLRKQRRRHSSDLLQHPGPSRVEPISPQVIPDDLDPQALGLSPLELEELRQRLEQEERDARLARQLSSEVDDHDALLADMRFAVEAQDGELARLLQEREYKKLQRAKERARQKALLKKQQRLAQQQSSDVPTITPQATLLDAYSNPRDLIREQSNLRTSKSVDSDLNYVEPFEKEQIQSKASALQSQEISRQWLMRNEPCTSQDINCNKTEHTQSYDVQDYVSNHNSMQYRNPPPVPTSGKKPRFPDPVSIRPASHYVANDDNSSYNFSNDIDNNNTYSSTFPPDHASTSTHTQSDHTKRLSVISDITSEGLAKKKNKQTELHKKKKGCKIQ